MWVGGCVWVGVCGCVWVGVWVWVSLCAVMGVWVGVLVWVSLSVCSYGCVGGCESVCVQLWVCGWVCNRSRVFGRTRLFMHMHDLHKAIAESE